MSNALKAYRANGTIRVARFVKIDSSDNNSVLEADAGERVIGISQIGGREAPIPAVTADPPEAAQATDSVLVHPDGDLCLLYLGTGGCTAGDLLKSDADGAGVALAEGAGTAEEVGAVALETASAGEYAKVRVRTQTVTTPA